jgi:GH15 family glucan-1,4-alpha-glucosidase
MISSVASPIEDYGLIGDLQTAALVSRDTSIDWCCFPRFDSSACFAALLGEEEHGCWWIRPRGAGPFRLTRRYWHDTLVLETVFAGDEGLVRVIDFMPPRETKPDIIRIVECLDGKVEMRTEIRVRFDYGEIVPWAHRVDGDLVFVAGPDGLCLRTPVRLLGENFHTSGDFTVEEGERIPFVLTWYPSHEPLPDPVDPEQALRDTEAFWRDWAEQCEHPVDDPYHHDIHRSLLTLKALTYAPTGGIVAAPTTSLPEKLGGVRNWDYRYTWLRDASITLLAMVAAGYTEEADRWRQWLLRAAGGDASKIQIMYGLAGQRRLIESELAHLPGYEGSAPVRIGNQASQQRQLDVYGEVIDALYQAREHGLKGSDEAWSLVIVLLEWLEEHWHEPDAGVWEVRGPNRHFTHSKVMAWVAFDRGVKLVERHGREGPADRWREIRERIHTEVCEQAWNEKVGAFTQYYGASRLDASVLLMALVGFLDGTDERIVSTVETIRRKLMVDGLVARYAADEENVDVDGLPPGEGAFLPCTFWLADNLCLQGRFDEAREIFEHLLSLRNDLGLLAEEYDTILKRQLGNFPQAWSHVALVSTGFNLTLGEEMWSRRQAARPHHTP